MIRRILIKLKKIFNLPLTKQEFQVLMNSLDDIGDPDDDGEISIFADPFEGKAIKIPIEDHIDLHTFAPNETRPAVDAYLEEAIEHGFHRVRIITGRGRGIQRRMIRSLLENHSLVERYEDARPEEGGWGATIAYLKMD